MPSTAYEHGGELRNPVNDVFAIKQVLSQVGFEVLEYYNLDYRSMKRAVDDYGIKLEEYNVGLFFYAGHGIQAKGYNYLIPVDANLNSENDVEYDCINAARVLGKMEDIFKQARIMVVEQSDGAQTPWESTSLMGDFYFNSSIFLDTHR